ncbi:hypothetical protein JWG42_16085 [Desulfoprunum benzoelyticum]|uniref:Uncharacterized protein n=1 Tax=Desulfoprunum benzoelyticum TaxID=1506996 RepID=A0A840UPV3_9BACT|nr:hypothetical protein [Desulfoprunum benzoelyticum]MBB5347812.1 hypothetical protein [Desulfoprunum benzoelyticum]MBM9531678.1 hypothetical protein [Desulfoprunum benzoelyticum]
MREQAEPLLAEIDRYLEAPLNQDVAARLIENRNGITKLLDALDQKHFGAAFIGKIGVGKTSAICKVADLQYDGPDNEQVEVLKTGAGRTTVCEVAIEYAPRYSIKVEPMPNEEVQRIVSNFADFIWAKAHRTIADEDEGGNLLSEELTRCIRNMLGLTIEKKKEDGKWRSSDKALEFSKNCKSVEEVNELMFSCLSLESRTETEFWPNPEESKRWQVWLKEIFARINDGKNKTVSIPARIIIRGPFPLMQGGSVWSIVDTRGIDSYIHREDIRRALDTEGVFPVICSSFVDAPDADCRSFYELGVELGLGSRVARDVTLLILDKNESDKIADIDSDITDLEDRKSIGRSIREEQVSNKIAHEYKISPNVITFDSRIDAESEIWEALESRRSAYITSKSRELVTLLSASQELLSAEGSKAEAFEHDIHALMVDWRANADARSPDWSHFGEYIKSVFSATHHRTLAASIDRKGSWYNLNVYEAINQRARSSAVKFCGTEILEIKNSFALLRGKYPEFSNQIDALESECVAQFDSFSVYVGVIAMEHWIEQVKTFVSIWHSMAAEWGRGSGYKNRVIEHWIAWIKSEQSILIHNALLRRIASAWGRVLTEGQG